MKIKIYLPCSREQFNEIPNRLRKDVNLLKVEHDFIEFESKTLFEYMIVGRIFTIVDFGNVLFQNNKVIYTVVSIKYWLLLTGVFFISGVLPNQYLMGTIVTSIIGSFGYIITYIRHSKYINMIIQ